MWAQAGLARLAEEFWELAGGQADFPHDLKKVVSVALPLVIQEKPGLSTSHVSRWLHEHCIAHQSSRQERRVHGCLVALGGHGFLFVDTSDSYDEQRFTVAHEIAHFLLDYWQPRQKALTTLGEGITPVLDGLRQPTHRERLEAVLGTVPLGLHLDIMGRTLQGAYMLTNTLDLEVRADRLALELLAPTKDVLANLSVLQHTQPQFYDVQGPSMEELLQERYGLPPTVAQLYSRALSKEHSKGPGIMEWLGT